MIVKGEVKMNVDGLKHNLISKEEICLVSSVKNEEAWLWHTKFCHLNFHTLDKLVRLKLVKGLPDIKFEKDHLCSDCEMGKLRRSSHKTKSDPSYDKPLQMFTCDLCGPISVQSLGGKKYILVLIDEFSRFTWVEFMKKKSQVPLILINLLKRLHVRVLRSDNGTGFKNSVIEEYLASVGITHNFSAPRTPQQNGVVERKNRTLVDAARTMLNASGIPLTFWAKAVSAACYTQNRSLVVKRFEKTPYQLLHNKRPNIKFFHVFGKIDPKGDDAIVIGYSWNSVAYRVTQDKYTEELKIQAEKSSNTTIPQDLVNLFNECYEDEPDPDRASADVPRAFVEDHPVTDASPQSTKVDQKSSLYHIIGSPSAPVTTRSSKLNENLILFGGFLSDFKPSKTQEALSDPDWVKAIQEELAKFERNKLWRLVERPWGKSIIDLRWIFRNKKDENDHIIRNKARLVAKGYRQQEGIDYDETFAPVRPNRSN
ncbi:hypothetical protein OSB04_001647 [Centaurea solstitialis]|uniref:Integrase catalytic domain-containing protein n=1 Tax=Centaurea solstitialis TaxID=347529 RepID=A0AA38U403_9ASTR|nr:hypothetical protein OSB04_001647 [Centaurea solstitialis]